MNTVFLKQPLLVLVSSVEFRHDLLVRCLALTSLSGNAACEAQLMSVQLGYLSYKSYILK